MDKHNELNDPRTYRVWRVGWLSVSCRYRTSNTALNPPPPIHGHDALSFVLHKEHLRNSLFFAVFLGSLFQGRPPSQVVVLNFIVLCSVFFDQVSGFLVVSLHQVFHFLVVFLLKFHKGFLLLQLFNGLRFHFCNE